MPRHPLRWYPRFGGKSGAVPATVIGDEIHSDVTSEPLVKCSGAIYRTEKGPDKIGTATKSGRCGEVATKNLATK